MSHDSAWDYPADSVPVQSSADTEVERVEFVKDPTGPPLYTSEERGDLWGPFQEGKIRDNASTG